MKITKEKQIIKDKIDVLYEDFDSLDLPTLQRRVQGILSTIWAYKLTPEQRKKRAAKMNKSRWGK